MGTCAVCGLDYETTVPVEKDRMKNPPSIKARLVQACKKCKELLGYGYP